MKVAFISQPFGDVVPPVEGNSLVIWTYQVARRLTSACDFIIYARKGPGQQQVQWHEHIEYRRIPVTLDDQLLKPLKLLERILGHPAPKRPLFSSSLFYLGYILQIAWDLRAQQCDIVHIFNFPQFASMIRAFNPQVKIVLHMQCEWLSQLDRAMIERQLKQVDLVIGCSDYITNKVRERFPQFGDRCQTVFNGADVHQLVYKPDDRVAKNGQMRLLFVGRVSPEKGVHVLLEAFEKVVPSYPQAQLDIVGPGGNAPFEYMVLVSDDKKVNALGSFYNNLLRRGDYFSELQRHLPPVLAERVNFVGPISHSRLINYYREADLLINPSLTEAFGMSLVEAMASEVPVVATAVGGMTEIVGEGQAGLLVESGNPTALAEAILSLLKDGHLRKLMGQTGRKQVIDRYSWDQIAASLFAQYRCITQNHG
jgi:glycosyltransferase involved in cell wall biosynthesis